jgi:hypothetical protein
MHFINFLLSFFFFRRTRFSLGFRHECERENVGDGGGDNGEKFFNLAESCFCSFAEIKFYLIAVGRLVKTRAPSRSKEMKKSPKSGWDFIESSICNVLHTHKHMYLMLLSLLISFIINTIAHIPALQHQAGDEIFSISWWNRKREGERKKEIISCADAACRYSIKKKSIRQKIEMKIFCLLSALLSFSFSARSCKEPHCVLEQ